MLFELVNVSALRIILQQPSPVWKEFKIEDLKIYRSSEVCGYDYLYNSSCFRHMMHGLY